MAHAWKACWGQPLAGSNPASSAKPRPFRKNDAFTQPGRRIAATIKVAAVVRLLR